VSKAVEPKRKKLEEAKTNLQVILKKLGERRALLLEVEDKIHHLSQEYKSVETKRRQLEQKVNECQLKLSRAEKLLGGLGGEKVRWEKRTGDLKESFDTLTGDVLLSAAFVVYLGAFTSSYRTKLVGEWQAKLREENIKYSENWMLSSAVGDYSMQIRGWNLMGLPTDIHSIENAIITLEGKSWPLIIDPQVQLLHAKG
jgi:dynein heavy chain